MLTLLTVQEAQASILRRDNTLSLHDVEMTEAQKAAATQIYGSPLTPEQGVRHILSDVQQHGDAALKDWTAKLDKVELDRFEIPKTEFAAGLARIDSTLRQALETAAQRIRAFHEMQPLPNWTTSELGGTLGQRVTPIRRVGVYVPGGTAPLPSTLLMCAIPARVAGVKELIVTTPPDKNGGVPDVILAVAALAEIDQLYTVGGAQAIGALTFGTETIRRVDKIVGPGNLWVTLAKRQVYGFVGVDGLYGPTETAVVADSSANPAWIAADMLAQAEHDVLATAILFTPSQPLAEAIQVELGKQLELRARAEIIEQSLTRQGGIVITRDMDEACQLASDFAAEHTCIASDTPAQYLEKIPDAGGLFVGEHSFEVLGDYVAGPSHVMPTEATARFASPLNVSDFVKINSIIQLDSATAAALSPLAATIAQAEGLDGHAAAALQRVKDEA
ncbi:MAG: histidinol dehydrogenase [Chloroflexota bacterium]